MAFSQKILSVSFSLSQGQFQGGGNSATITGLRMSARITTPGGEDTGNLELSIYGMRLSDMQQLTVLPTALNAIGQNTVTVMAGDDASALTTVFTGTINLAYVDAQAQPQVCFRVFAIAGLVQKVKPIPATSVQGSGDVANTMQTLAGQMGFQFENSGVSGKLQNIYLPGAGLQQVAALARHAGIEWTLDCNTLAVWPAGQARNIAPTTVSPQTGLVAYPAFTSSGLILTTLFQGTLKFGAKITVQSQLQPACGDWFVNYIEYALDTLTPNGLWFAVLTAGRISVGQDNAGS